MNFLLTTKTIGNNGKMMKHLICTLLAFFTAFPVQAADTQQAQAFAETLADKIMTQVVKSSAPSAEKRAAFRKIFLGATDIHKIARFTLGRYARTADKEQIDAFTQAFTDNIILTWADRFGSYAGVSVKFKGVRQDKNDFYVTSSLDVPDTENDIEIIWRINAKNDKPTLSDLVVEGVSMLLSYRNEYSSVLQQSNGDLQILINLLNQKNEALRNPKKK